jgi:hypothetical protein
MDKSRAQHQPDAATDEQPGDELIPFHPNTSAAADTGRRTPAILRRVKVNVAVSDGNGAATNTAGGGSSASSAGSVGQVIYSFTADTAQQIKNSATAAATMKSPTGMAWRTSSASCRTVCPPQAAGIVPHRMGWRSIAVAGRLRRRLKDAPSWTTASESKLNLPGLAVGRAGSFRFTFPAP